MPRYEITAPDGGRYEITAPQGASDDEVMQYAQSQFSAPQPEAPAVETPQPEPSVARTIFDQGLQGLTFGAIDRGQDALGAIGAKLYDSTLGDNLMADQSYEDVFRDARAMSQERLQNQQVQRPVLSAVSQIGGGLIGGGAASGTKVGASLANSLGSGGTAARIAKGAAAGATSGAAYGIGTAEDGNELEGAGQGALYGAVGGAAVPAIGAAVGSAVKGGKNALAGATARSVDELDDAAKAMRDTAHQAYSNMRQNGAVFNPRATGKMATKIDTVLSQDGILHPSLHPKTIGLVESIKDEMRKGGFSLERADQWRRALGSINKIDGEDYRKAQLVIDAIDDTVDTLGSRDLAKGTKEAFSALKEGRQAWGQAKRFELVSGIVNKADGDANYIKRELKKLLDNPKKMRGFSPAEREALKQAATTSAGEGVMKMLGKFGFDMGNSRIGNTALPVIGGYASGGALLPTAGTAARYGQKALARGKVENVLRTIEGTAGQAAGKAALPGAALPAGVSAGNAGNQIAQHLGQAAMVAAPAAALTATGANAMETPRQTFSIDRQPTPESNSDNDDLANRINGAESNGNNTARPIDPVTGKQLSSAYGPGQFIDETWSSMVRKYGKKYGLTEEMRTDPEANRLATALLAEEHRAMLKTALRREPTDGELYLAHFAGIGGAKRLMKIKNKGAPAALILPEAAKSNPSIFYEGRTKRSKGRPRTVQEVIDLIGGKVA